MVFSIFWGSTVAKWYFVVFYFRELNMNALVPNSTKAFTWRLPTLPMGLTRERERACIKPYSISKIFKV